MKFNLFKILLVLFPVLFFGYSIGNVYAVYYATDNITNPSCAPGDSGCYVSLNTLDQNIRIWNATSHDTTSIGIGTLALDTITGTDNYNYAIGEESMRYATGGGNYGFGWYTLRGDGINTNNGSRNIGIGEGVLNKLQSGNDNIGMGNAAFNALTTGSSNISIGRSSQRFLTTGSNNTSLGYASLLNNISGSGNVSIGSSSGSSTTGSYNTLIGYSNGANLSSGSYNIAIGHNIDLPSNTSDGQLNIGNLIYGTGLYSTASASSTPVTAGMVGIGTTAPGERLEVVGNIISKGTSWTIRSSAADQSWRSVTYGNGIFVAVSTQAGVMTSPDGVTWTSRTSGTAQPLRGVCYGNGLFVGISSSGSSVITSPDGINWTTRTAANANQWRTCAYGGGLFVAISETGTGDRVMTSPDGINWTLRTSAADNTWINITYGAGLFVATSIDGTGNRVMTSPDGITWTSRTSAADNQWYGLTYGNGLFVAVSATGTGNRVMTSPDGITWTTRTSAADNTWVGLTYGNGLFVAVGQTGTGNRVMTSPDGITWTTRTSAADISWRSVVYGNGVFVATADSGTGNRVMTSGKSDYIPVSTNNIFQGGLYSMGNFGIGTSSPLSNLHIYTSASNNPRGIVLDQGGGNSGRLFFMSNSSPGYDIYYNGAFGGGIGGLYFAAGGVPDSTSGSTMMTISSDGRLTVNNGANIGSYSLNVGSSSVSGIVARFQNSTGTCDINPTTTSLSCSSDRNLKTNITNLNNTILNQITTLQPVTYNWISDPQGTTQTGFIAQDVEQIFPNLVFTDPNTSLKSLNYIGLIPYAIEGIKELNLKVDEIASLDLSKSNSVGSMIVSFLRDQIVFAKEMTIGVLRVNNQICVDDVCATKEQFKTLLMQAGAGQNSDSQVDNNAPEPDNSQSVNPVEEPNIQNSDDDQNTDSTDLISETNPIVPDQVAQ